MSRCAQIAAVTALLSVMTACGDGGPGGDDGDLDENDRPAAGGAAYPDCDEVWVAGEVLPDDVEGCEAGEDTFVTTTRQQCPDDAADLVIYEGDGTAFYTDAAGVVVEVSGGDLGTDPGYLSRAEACGS